MKFCEKCNFLTDEERCPVCNNKKLRDIADEDFCYYISLDVFYCEMLECALKEKNIDVVCVPYYPNGVSRANAGRASGRKVYVRYKDIDSVTEIYNSLFFSSENEDN